MHAQTTVGGVLTGDAHWTLSGSPYIVTANLLVDSNVTLTIDPGVVVRFDLSRYMKVIGTLVADGTAAQPIRFTSNQSTPAKNDWGGIRFTGIAGTVYDNAGRYVSGSLLRHSVFTYADAACHVSVFGVLIDHCSFSFNSAAVDLAYTDGMRFVGCRFEKNDYGILNESNGGAAHTIVRECSFIDQRSAGIRLSADQFTVSELEITRCRFSGNYYGIWLGMETYGVWVERSVIAYNLFTRNQEAMWLAGVRGRSPDPEPHLLIEKNICAQNSSAAIRSGYQALTMTIRRNIIMDNPFGFRVRSSDGGRLTLSDNLFVVNGVAARMEEIDRTTPSYWTFSGNTFIGIGNTVFSLHSGNGYTISGNNFIANAGTLIENRTRYDVNAPDNFWGFGRDSAQLGSVMYDYFDDFEYGKVLTGSIAPTPWFTAPIAPPSGVTREVVDGVGSIAWRPSDDPRVIGYRVHWGRFDGGTYEHTRDVGAAVGAVLSDVSADAAVAVTAYTEAAAGMGADAMFEGEESWYAEAAQASSSVDRPTGRGTAGAHALPNPFSGSTEIAFTLEHPGPVRVQIFDARGALVRTLGDGGFETGGHRVRWDGFDAAGTPLAPSVYYCVVRHDGRADVVPIVLRER